MPCEQGVAIPTIFGLMNAYRLYGLKDYAQQRYRRLGSHSRRGHMAADACIECGQCEEKCPQNIPIIKQLKQAHKALSDSGKEK
jgi:predicted aldo/keto reductase-like oxidoreductase